MPHIDITYSADLELPTGEMFGFVEDTINTLDPGAGVCKSRAWPCADYRHSHVAISIALLPKPHRDQAFLGHLLGELETGLKRLIPVSCYFSLGIDFSPGAYVTDIHRVGDADFPVAAGALKARSAAAVQAALDAAGMDCVVREMPASTRTAREAAAAIGCDVSQIAKCIVFEVFDSGEPLLVVASGSNRIDEQVIADHIGDALAMASPETVRRATGFAIGGVPPCGHPAPITTLVDRDLVAMDEIWAAAGTPHAVFRLTPPQLLRLTRGNVVAVTR